MRRSATWRIPDVSDRRQAGGAEAILTGRDVGHRRSARRRRRSIGDDVQAALSFFVERHGGVELSATAAIRTASSRISTSIGRPGSATSSPSTPTSPRCATHGTRREPSTTTCATRSSARAGQSRRCADDPGGRFDGSARRCPASTEDVKWGQRPVLLRRRQDVRRPSTSNPPNQVAFKCTPDTFAELIEREGIIPAPYLARAMWVQEGELGVRARTA